MKDNIKRKSSSGSDHWNKSQIRAGHHCINPILMCLSSCSAFFLQKPQGDQWLSLYTAVFIGSGEVRHSPSGPTHMGLTGKVILTSIVNEFQQDSVASNQTLLLWTYWNDDHNCSPLTLLQNEHFTLLCKLRCHWQRHPHLVPIYTYLKMPVMVPPLLLCS